MSAPSLLELEGVAACCDDETWELIPGWPHESSTCGRVRSITRIDAEGRLRLGQMLPQLPNDKGYMFAVLTDGKRRRRVHVAVAVLEAHRGLKPTPGHEAGHEHGIRGDNHLARLSWVTKVQNRADRERHRRERASALTCGVTALEATRYSRSVKSGRNGQKSSRGRRLPTWAASRLPVTPTRYRDGFSTTGSSPFPFNFPSVPLFLNPFSILRSLRSRRIPR